MRLNFEIRKIHCVNVSFFKGSRWKLHTQSLCLTQVGLTKVHSVILIAVPCDWTSFCLPHVYFYTYDVKYWAFKCLSYLSFPAAECIVYSACFYEPIGHRTVLFCIKGYFSPFVSYDPFPRGSAFSKPRPIRSSVLQYPMILWEESNYTVSPCPKFAQYGQNELEI